MSLLERQAYIDIKLSGAENVFFKKNVEHDALITY
jgi:hypothetical protein